MVLLQVNRGIGAHRPQRDFCCLVQKVPLVWVHLCSLQTGCMSNTNIVHAELRKNAFAYLPGEPKLFNMKAGKRDNTESRVTCLEMKKRGGGWKERKERADGLQWHRARQR